MKKLLLNWENIIKIFYRNAERIIEADINIKKKVQNNFFNEDVAGAIENKKDILPVAAIKKSVSAIKFWILKGPALLM